MSTRPDAGPRNVGKPRPEDEHGNLGETFDPLHGIPAGPSLAKSPTPRPFVVHIAGG
jgi:hypothetical protein